MKPDNVYYVVLISYFNGDWKLNIASETFLTSCPIWLVTWWNLVEIFLVGCWPSVVSLSYVD